MSDIKLSVEEAAMYLEVSARTMQNWRTDGVGPRFYKPTEKVYYYQSDLDRWIKGE